jgi:hypothetical protein
MPLPLSQLQSIPSHKSRDRFLSFGLCEDDTQSTTEVRKCGHRQDALSFCSSLDGGLVSTAPVSLAQDTRQLCHVVNCTLDSQEVAAWRFMEVAIWQFVERRHRGCQVQSIRCDIASVLGKRSTCKAATLRGLLGEYYSKVLFESTIRTEYYSAYR